MPASCNLLCRRSCSACTAKVLTGPGLRHDAAQQLANLACGTIAGATVLCRIAGLVSVKGWMVWERQGNRSAFSHSTYVRPSTTYEETILPFFDSYAQVHRLHSVLGPCM